MSELELNKPMEIEERENPMKFNANLAPYTYLSTVNELVEEFFSVDGEYQPHIGNLNAMRLFYNKCVGRNRYTKHYNEEMIHLEDMWELVADGNFIKAFNEAIKFDGIVKCDFANAYHEAMKIVDAQNNPFTKAVNTVSVILNDIIDKINPVLTPENLAAFAEISQNIGEGNSITADDIVKAYADRMENTEE